MSSSQHESPYTSFAKAVALMRLRKSSAPTTAGYWCAMGGRRIVAFKKRFSRPASFTSCGAAICCWKRHGQARLASPQPCCRCSRGPSFSVTAATSARFLSMVYEWRSAACRQGRTDYSVGNPLTVPIVSSPSICAMSRMLFSPSSSGATSMRPMARPNAPFDQR